MPTVWAVNLIVQLQINSVSPRAKRRKVSGTKCRVSGTLLRPWAPGEVGHELIGPEPKHGHPSFQYLLSNGLDSSKHHDAGNRNIAI